MFQHPYDRGSNPSRTRIIDVEPVYEIHFTNHFVRSPTAHVLARSPSWAEVGITGSSASYCGDLQVVWPLICALLALRLNAGIQSDLHRQ